MNGWGIYGLNVLGQLKDKWVGHLWLKCMGGGGQKVTVFHNWSSGKYLCRSLHNNGFRSFKFLISWPMTYYRNHRTTLYLILALRSPAWLVKLHYCCNEMHYSPLPVVFFFLLFVKLTFCQAYFHNALLHMYYLVTGWCYHSKCKLYSINIGQRWWSSKEF